MASVEIKKVNHLVESLDQFPFEGANALEDAIAKLDAAESNMAHEIAADLRLVLKECKTMVQAPTRLPVLLCELILQASMQNKVQRRSGMNIGRNIPCRTTGRSYVTPVLRMLSKSMTISSCI